MAKRIYLNMIERLDQQKGESNVRELEMIVDSITLAAGEQPYTMQFFQDCRVYGVKEARLYLQNFIDRKPLQVKQLTQKDFVNLGEVVERITKAIG